MQGGRIGPLNTGLEDITRWRQSDEAHLPAGQSLRVPFAPEQRALDAILRRETLEERLAGFVVPDRISPELGEAGAIRNARLAAGRRFALLATQAHPATAAALRAAVELLSQESTLDNEVQTALAALLRA